MNLSKSEFRGLCKTHPEFKKLVPGHHKKGKSQDEFQSLAEQRYFERFIFPMLKSGEISQYEMHLSYVVIPQIEHMGNRFKERVYTPDFVLLYASGNKKIVEIKGEKIRKLQRDYPLRKQLFIMNYCIPNHWEFEEVKAESLTQCGL